MKIITVVGGRSIFFRSYLHNQICKSYLSTIIATKIGRNHSSSAMKRTMTLLQLSKVLLVLFCHSQSLIEAFTTLGRFSAPIVTANLRNAGTCLSAERTTVARNWKFQGHKVYTEVTKPPVIATATDGSPSFFFDKQSSRNDKKCSVVLIHGFGCSVSAMSSAGYTVHTIDLLGQGKSDKPGREDGVDYSTNLWADLVDQFCRECVPPNHSIVLIGNSLGSVVALAAAVADFAGGDSDTSVTTIPSCRIVGVGLYNCGVGMNSRNLLKDPQLNAIQKVIFTACLICLTFSSSITSHCSLTFYPRS